MYKVEDYINPFWTLSLSDAALSGSLGGRGLGSIAAPLQDDWSKRAATINYFEDSLLLGRQVCWKTAATATPEARCLVSNQDAFIITRYCLDRLVSNILHLDEILQNT